MITGLTVGVVAGLVTGGMGLIGTAAVGGAAIIHANVAKMITENGRAKKVEELGKIFLSMVGPMKKELEEIKNTCATLKEKSTEAQAQNCLSDMERFQEVLSRVSDLAKTNKEALNVAVVMMEAVRGMIILPVAVFRVTATPQQDKELTDAIVQSADRCREVWINEGETLRVLREVPGGTREKPESPKCVLRGMLSPGLGLWTGWMVVLWAVLCLWLFKLWNVDANQS